jgi:hypothetical protein
MMAVLMRWHAFLFLGLMPEVFFPPHFPFLIGDFALLLLVRIFLGF